MIFNPVCLKTQNLENLKNLENPKKYKNLMGHALAADFSADFGILAFSVFRVFGLPAVTEKHAEIDGSLARQGQPTRDHQDSTTAGAQPICTRCQLIRRNLSAEYGGIGGMGITACCFGG